jgi:hypothetical protein
MRTFTSYLAFAATAYTQSSAYTDANTGITFEGYEDTTGFRFGMAVPTTPATDFIGQIVCVHYLPPKIRRLTLKGHAHKRFRIWRCFSHWRNGW